MNLRFLRPNLPTSPTLTVSQLPCVAKLDQNESPHDVPPELKRELLDELATLEWNRYPQPADYDRARRAFARALDVDPDGLALTAGCDQAIQAAHFLAGGPGRRALVFEPTYPMLAHGGLLAGTTVERVLCGPGYDVPLEAMAQDHDLVLLAYPNNPTGTCVSREHVEAALARPRLVFVDEAYHNLSGVTVADLLPTYPHLMIGRSCSKALLAGLRLGYALCHPEVALRTDQLLTAPYHLSHAQLLVARRFDLLRPHVEAAARQVVAERERLRQALEHLSLEVYPSETNFLLVRLEGADQLYEHLAQQGVRVRYAPKIPGLAHHLRLTIGSPRDNDLLLRLLQETLGHGARS